MPKVTKETNQVFESSVVMSAEEISTVEQSREESSTFEDISTAFQGIREQSLNTIMKWAQTFSDSEKFDNFYEKRIDELIKEASELEQTLISQKEMLKERLKNLTKTLALVTDSES